MGREFKKRWRETTGRQAVVGYEVVNMGLATEPASALNRTMADAFSVDTYKCTRASKVDALTIQCQPQLVSGSGTVTVRLNVDGVEQASGTVGTGERAAEYTWQTEKLNELRVDADSEITLDVTKGATPSGVDVSARVQLRLFE